MTEEYLTSVAEVLVAYDLGWGLAEGAEVPFPATRWVVNSPARSQNSQVSLTI